MRDALQKLDGAGHTAYLVGGSVRDYFLRRPSKDHDIATSAKPDEVLALFPSAIDVGRAFGVIKVPLGREEYFEIATFREDLDYADHRHPKSVKYTEAENDAKRRDFTINALYYDPKTARVLDSVGGIEDLKQKVLRAIGNPQQRFKEDALRLLRAVRFSSNLGFSLEKTTAEAIRARAKLIVQVSGERIREELNLILVNPRPDEAFETMSRLGILRHILPELEAAKGVQQSPLYHPEGDVWQHTLKILKNIANQNPVRTSRLGWAAALHDVGKAAAYRKNDGKNFKGHEQESNKIAKQIAERLRFSSEDFAVIEGIIADHGKFREVFQMREATLERFVRLPYFEELLALHRADATAADGNLAYYEFCKKRLEILKEGKSREIPRLLDGNDLIQLGLSPGRQFTEILRAIEDLALEKTLNTKEEALEYVIQHFVH